MSRICFKIIWKMKETGNKWRNKTDHALAAVEPEELLMVVQYTVCSLLSKF